jgi:hypothetical protein
LLSYSKRATRPGEAGQCQSIRYAIFLA